MPEKTESAETPTTKKVRKKTSKKAPAKKAPAKKADASSDSIPSNATPVAASPAKDAGESDRRRAPAKAEPAPERHAERADAGQHAAQNNQPQQQRSNDFRQREQRDRGERPDNRDRGERSDRGERPDNRDRGERSERGERGERVDRSEHRTDRTDRGERDRNGQGNDPRGDSRNDMRNRRKKQKNKNKKRRPHGGMGIPANALPADEDLDRDAEQVRSLIREGAYAKLRDKALRLDTLEQMNIKELHDFAEKEGVEEASKLARPELINQVMRQRGASEELLFASGTLMVAPEGFGFLRSAESSYTPSVNDIYVSPSMIRRTGLRPGMVVTGAIRPPADNERFFALVNIDDVNGRDPKELRTLPIFEDLTPLHPEDRFVLETTPDVLETRVIDLVAPIGRGQRALIVAPPRTGKTVLMQKITRAISTNYPDVRIIVLLIDERPEEVTDFRRNTGKGVEVVASTFDEQSTRHVQVAEMVMEKARRYVEFGEHVVILLDSITRLARAYNAASPNSGRIMTGGIDSNALSRPKKFFGSARAIEGGGSLTILGTALVDTGSKADEVIFEEFKGTGNSELHLDRKLVEKRIYPAIDVAASGTRREELLLDPKELQLVYRLRKVVSDMNVVQAMELMLSKLGKTKSNAEFLMTMNLG